MVIIKLKRLLEITTVLLNKKTVTAAELAERFGVSTRTIYRDVEVLSVSGFPVCATQGANGGISILEDYTINRTALSASERDSILLALETLQSTRYPAADTALEKLGSIFNRSTSDWISVDFPPWGSNPNAVNKLTDIRAAIIQSKVIEIDYINSHNEKSRRKIEPLRLIFKSQAWYLWGYCHTKFNFRTFKLSRIKNVIITSEDFDKTRDRVLKEKSGGQEQEYKMLHLVLEFAEDVMYRLCDDYDDNMLTAIGDGKYRLEIDFPEGEWVLGYILSFGCYVKVIEPEHIQRIIWERCKKISEFYEPYIT